MIEPDTLNNEHPDFLGCGEFTLVAKSAIATSEGALTLNYGMLG
jgi:hypothetical protein